MPVSVALGLQAALVTEGVLGRGLVVLSLAGPRGGTPGGRRG
ncbi:hypothetical protein [Actinoalloteichus spitiensis]|nr:hypothetical protein [Actinoalloteichus spitiensis]